MKIWCFLYSKTPKITFQKTELSSYWKKRGWAWPAYHPVHKYITRAWISNSSRCRLFYTFVPPKTIPGTRLHTHTHNCRREENNTKTIIVCPDLRPRITVVIELSPRRFTYVLCKRKRRLVNPHAHVCNILYIMGTLFNPTCQK